MRRVALGLSGILALLCSGCTSIPDGLEAVANVDTARYMGTWYEVARLDHSFERNLTHVSATYTLRAGGKVDVINKGYDPVRRQWREARGVARRVEPVKGRFKVSFFRPFYGAYNVIDLEPVNYSYAVVCGPDRSYFWILAREKSLPQATLDGLKKKAREWGFAVDDLIYPKQDDRPAEPTAR